MTDKQMMALFLFGGRCVYQGRYYNVVDHDSNRYTLQLQNSSERLTGVRANECETPPERLESDGYLNAK